MSPSTSHAAFGSTNAVKARPSRGDQIDKLVWMESHETMDQAIARERQIKRWSKVRRRGLIDQFNPEWRDRYGDLA